MTSPPQDRPLTVDEYTDWNLAQLARIPVTRRSLLKGAAVGAGAAALSAFPFARQAFAAAGGRSGTHGLVLSGRHLSWVQDHGGDPTNAMRMTAQLLSPSGRLPKGLKAVVEVGDTQGHYGHRVEADIVHLLGMYVISGGPLGSQFYVKAELTNLRPGTVHHYRFRLSDGTTTGDAFFVTAPSRRFLGTGGPEPAAFTFTAFADVGTNVAPTDPRFAWGHDPLAVTQNNGTWPKGTFDGNFYNAADPVAGTNGTDPHPAVTQTNLMSTQRPRFTLLAGDISYADPAGSGLPADDTLALTAGSPPGTNSYDPYVWDVFLAQIDGQAAYSPWMFATGNHDMEALYSNTEFLGDSPTHGYASHAKRLDLPKNGPHTCPTVYNFVYANVGVIAVDANDLSNEIQTNKGYSDGAQLRYLEDTLKRWRNDSTIDFIVTFFHHCAYSTTLQHASDGGVRDALDRLFTKYEVDLAIQGHNHIMERTDPIKNGRPTRKAPDGSTIEPAKDGVTYICIGCGGRPRYAFQPAPSATNPPPAGTPAPVGPEALPEGQRYRGYQPPGGPNSAENNTENVLNSYVWVADGTAVNASGYPQGTKMPETIEWSQVRYDDYAFLAIDVKPARVGRTTTMTIRTLADALPGRNEPYSEIDRVTLKRTAGKNRIRH